MPITLVKQLQNNYRLVIYAMLQSENKTHYSYSFVRLLDCSHCNDRIHRRLTLNIPAQSPNI